MRTLVIVSRDTVVRWHHNGLRRYWRSISKPGPGRPPLSKEVRELIVRMATENGWRARKIQAELVKLGIRVSLATLSRYLPKIQPDQNRRQRWMTFPEEPTHRFLVYDNDAIFSAAVMNAIESFQISPRRTAFRSPWQSGTAERVVGSFRRELLDHVIALDEDHLERLLREYVDYYNAGRVHTELRDSPVGRPVESRNSPRARVG